MHHYPLLLSFARLVQSQLWDPDSLARLPSPSFVGPPLDTVKDIPLNNSAVLSMLNAPAGASSKRHNSQRELDNPCMLQPIGPGPVPFPDTVKAFQSFDKLQELSEKAQAPKGYDLEFSNINSALVAHDYMGLHTLDSYDTVLCASYCDSAPGCMAFNAYIERDPTLKIDQAKCPSPPSMTNYKCSLWGAPITIAEATNTGQALSGFQIAVTGSNGYNKNTPPEPINRYDGPTELTGAINADHAKDLSSYMGFQFFPFNQTQGFDPQTCADACNAMTKDNSQHPAEDGAHQNCVFFNAYVLIKNSVPQGLYCSLYNRTWDTSKATLYSLIDGVDQYKVSNSYSYSLSNRSSLSNLTPRACSQNPVIQNGDFEDGILPPTFWHLADKTGNTKLGITKPGSINKGGTYALVVSLSPSASSRGSSSVVLSQLMNTCPHTYYSISADFRYGGLTAEDCAITVKYPFKNGHATVTAPSGFQPAKWITTGATFQATSYAATLSITLECKNGARNSYSLDNVKVSMVNGK